MRSIEDFLPYVMPFAPGCPEPVAEHYLREAAIEFCQETRSWREILEYPSKGEEEILCAPPYAALHQLETAHFDGSLLRPVPVTQIGPNDRTGNPQVITQTTLDAVRIWPTATIAGTLRLSMFLKPSRSAEMLPRFLFDHYARDIGNGALGMLLMLPNEPFTNPNMAMLRTTMFQTAKDNAFAISVQGQQNAPLRTKPRYF